MSTRAIINVSDKLNSFNIYVHWDGWPERVIPSIEIASKYAWSLPRFEAGDFATALIKVLKKRAWEIYLINSKDEISYIYYFYEIYEEDWELKIRRTDKNSNQFLHRGL